MKKISMIFLSLLAIVLITGCGSTNDKEQKLVCTMTESESGIDFEQVISMTYKNDKLKHLTMEVNTTVTDATLKENWDEYKKIMTESTQEFEKDGVSLKVNVNDKSYEYDTILDIDVENASEEVLKEQGFEDLKSDNSTLEETKKEAEADGAICEIR